MTNTATPEDCLEILRAAMREDIGLLLQVSDFARARQAFYRARAEAADPDLAVLQFRSSPGLAGGNLIIVKQKITLTEQTLQEELPEPDHVGLAYASVEDLHDL